MRFVPKFNVGVRLTLAMILVVVVSWLLGGMLVFQLNRKGILQPGPPRRVLPIGARAPMMGRPMPFPESGVSARPGPQFRLGPRRGRFGRGGPPSIWQNPMLRIHLAVGLLVAIVAGVWLSRRFTRPLAILASGAQALERGDLDHRIALTGDDEFVRVGHSMNRMAERLTGQIQELAADSLRRQHLLADVAHELRSPVATLKAMAEALRDGVANSPERSERAIHAIVDSAERMERLVTDLLELARLDLDELPLYCQPVNLHAIILDCLRRHKQATDANGIVLLPFKEDDEEIIVSADPHRLSQILDNLLNNVISHAGKGAEVRVTVEPGPPVAVTIADTGRGISAEHVPFLFDPFYRVDAARTPGDAHSGLGLRIARGLAQAHGGDLRIESEEGRGTRAIVSLPR